VPTALIIISGLSLASLAVSGCLGGKLAFNYGVRVADEDTPAAGFNPTTPAKD
jgi:hypothetical protein